MTTLLRRREITFAVPVQIAPSATAHEQLQRVEEWTQKSTGAPPSNRKRSVKEHENDDLEVKSQLIAEAVKLLDSRDKQTRPKTPPANNDLADVYENESDEMDTEASQYYVIGKHFRNSQLSARNYVKRFETKMKRKKAHTEAISRMYPSMRSKKDFLQNLSRMDSILAKPNTSHVIEPDAWRFKASRSVKFAVKSASQDDILQKLIEEGSEDGEKWEMKQENDRDWWKWKLRQRFLQNDELLHKLASQRQKLELSLVQGETHRGNRNAIFNNKSVRSAPIRQKSILQSIPSARNSSWHVSVEIPSHMTPSSAQNSRRLTSSAIRESQLRARDPIPNFYTPSKEVVNVITNPVGTANNLSADSESAAKQKLKVLKKDPYLSKLLEGNEMFRPEMMLEEKQQSKRHQLSQDHKSASGSNARRKLSLESLTDTEDELTASKFFNPDVKVLYERLSEMEMMNANNFAEKSRLLGGINSREPSDGFLNLPILLETGRFSRYNKLPSMKFVSTNNKDPPSRQHTRKSDKSYKMQSTSNKIKKSNNLTSIRLQSAPLAGAGIGTATVTTVPEFNASTNNQQVKIEDLPTHEWAKRLMSKVKKQDHTNTKTDGDGNVEDATLVRKGDEINDMSNIQQQRKYKVPIDQETNLLYHEILMSKWKKDKHSKEKDGNNEAGGRNKFGSISKWKRGDVGHPVKKLGDGLLPRPRGLDIWLENIREKAKRDRVITPLSMPIKEGEQLTGMSQFIS